MTEQKDPRNLFSVFASTQLTFEEAKKKNSEESSKRATYFRVSKDGTYSIRILPLAPVIGPDGNPLPMERKGYEYPLRSQMLKIEDPSKMEKGKPKIVHVTVCNAKYVFGDRLKSDLIDTYVATACEKHADDEALVKKLREGSFYGGLKWDSKRCVYVIDLESPGDGIQILQLSYAQYKELEERKLNLWAKLNKNGRNVPCPISSIDAAYPVEIIRKTEGGKTSYSFNIDTISGVNELDEATLTTLLDTPRLPEVLYRYERYHLEATIAFLQQLDEKFGIDVVSSDEVQDCIEQIKMLLPADDNSHFSLNAKEGSSKAATPEQALDALFDRLAKLEDAGIDDKSDEGQELRADIKEFIDAQELEVKITRGKSNAALLDEIDAILYGDQEDEAEEDSFAAPSKKAAKPVEEEEEDDEPQAPEEEDEEEEEEPKAPASSKRERNDDTNEPAARPSRRAGRPDRRR